MDRLFGLRLRQRGRPARTPFRTMPATVFAGIFVLVSLVAASLGVAVNEAGGASCEENGVFWSMKDGSGQRATSWGARQEITLNQQTLKCVAAGGDPGTGHTSRVLLGGQTGNWVEAGHLTKICTGGSNCNRAFWEYKIAGVPGSQLQFSFSCLNPNTRHTYEVIREAPGGTWSGWMACYTTTWNYLATSPNLGYNQGFAEGEGFERGFVGDDWSLEGPMQETHSAMQWWAPSWASLNNANGLLCRADDSYRWDGSQTSSTSMTFVENHRGPGC